MARVLDELPPDGRGNRYPWDEWLDGRPWLLTKAEDYPNNASHANFAETMRSTARRRGLRLIARTVKEGTEQIGWAVQAVPLVENKPSIPMHKYASHELAETFNVR